MNNFHNLSELKNKRIRPYEGFDQIRIGKGGTFHSFNSKTGKSTPGGVLGEPKMDMNMVLGIANMAIGLVNVYKQQQTMSTMVQGFDDVRKFYDKLGLQLGVLYAQHEKIDHKLDILKASMDDNFDELKKSIVSTTTDRRMDEYVQRCIALYKAKERLSQVEKKPSMVDREYDNVLHRADDLDALIETHLRNADIPVLARQSYIIAKVDAILTGYDVRIERDREIIPFAIEKIDDILGNMLKEEVARLVEKASPWDVVVSIRTQIAIYGALHDALTHRREVLRRRGEDISEGPISMPRQVDHVLDSLPSTVSFEVDEYGRLKTVKNTQTVKLRTVDDYLWYIDAVGADRSSFDVHSMESITVRSMFIMLGCNLNARVNIDELKSVVNPKVYYDFNAMVKKVFDVESSVGLKKLSDQRNDNQSIASSLDVEHDISYFD